MREQKPKPAPAAQTYSIRDLASEFDVTTRAIRFYEDEGLISPARRGQTRLFSPRDRIRLKLILRGKRLGFSIEEIREIIDLYDAEPGEFGQLRFFLGKIAGRRAMLEQQQADIAETLEELAEVERRCLAQLKTITRRRP